MRKAQISLLVVLGFVLFIFSCKEDDFSEKDAYKEQQDLLRVQDSIDRRMEFIRDSLRRVGGVVRYAVNVVSSEDAGATKSALLLDDVDVTVSQNGVTQTKKTAKGTVVFEDLRIGTVAVTLSKTNFTDVSYVANIVFPDDPELSAQDVVRMVRDAATQVMMFSLTQGLATIKGVVTYEGNLVNDSSEFASGAEVIATMNVPNLAGKNLWTQGNVPGGIVSIAYSNAALRATTNANGEYEIKVPSMAGGIDYKVEVSDFVKNQQLLMNTLNQKIVQGVQTIRTSFGTGIGNFSAIPNVGGAYVEIGSPNGIIGEVNNDAQATALLDESGAIQTVHITNMGNGYTQIPDVVFNDPTEQGTGAEATAVVNNGKITQVNITNNGTKYSEATTVSLECPEDKGKGAVVNAWLVYPVKEILVTNSGSGYATTPSVVVVPPSSTGLSLTAIMEDDGTGNGTKRVKSVRVNNGGLYTDTATITIEFIGGNPTTDATAQIPWYGFDKTKAEIQFEIAEQGEGYKAKPMVHVNAVGGQQESYTEFVAVTSGGKVVGLTHAKKRIYNASISSNVQVEVWTHIPGEQASAHLRFGTVGIKAIAVTNAGNGYTATPDVVITGGGGTSATAVATVVDGKIAKVEVTNPGSGYTSSPNIKFVVSNRFEQATATLNVTDAGVVTGATITNAGTGYVKLPVSVTIKPVVDGVGSGATGKAQLNGNGGINIVITNGGAGYVTKNKIHGGATDAQTVNSLVSGKTVVKDFYLGSGKRSIEN